jgi:hypothetical protein
MSGESYFAGFVSFIAFMVTFLVLLRAPLKTGWFLLEILTGVVIHILSSIAGFILIEGFSYWYQASLYAFLWFCFFFVSSIYSASVSIGIISYLYDQPQYTASLQDVYQNCVANVFEQRVEFLVAQGLAQKTGEGYITTPKGKNTVRQLQLINKTLGMESQGFYSSTSTLVESGDMPDDQHS